MARGPKGESRATICDMIRERARPSASQRGKSREIFKEQVRILAQEGVDYFQILDQNLGGASFLCIGRITTIRRCRARGRPKPCGSFSMRLNDTIHARGEPDASRHRMRRGGPLRRRPPLQRFAGTSSASTTGSRCRVSSTYSTATRTTSSATSAAQNRRSTASNRRTICSSGWPAPSCSGEMLSVMLRDSGEIDWGTASDWNHPAPPQEPLPVLIRNLNAARRRHREFSASRGVDRVPLPVECGSYTLHYRNRQENFPSIASSGWRAADGRILQCFVNFLTEPQQCRIGGRTYTIPPLEVLTRELPGV